jgi:sulfoxide reductase catalytic subunit YedY
MKDTIPYSQITSKSDYLNRRQLLAAIPLALAGSRAFAGTKLEGVKKSQYSVDEKITPAEITTTYNNYYEFGTSKDQPAKLAQKFKTSPWTLTVEGEVAKKAKYDLNDIMKIAPLEERIYRHRCVEAWSIVVPWIGYSLNEILKKAEPTSKAKYVAFESYYDVGQMPQARFSGLQLPYVEGLRLDEAMHPLAMISVGMYGEALPNQDGAPVRLTIPWKYGFKSIKSIVKIRLVEKQPASTWNLMQPSEYGFYSNVNPDVDHPRWSQGTERRLGDLLKRKTLPFNGYGDQVAKLYTGMDLKKNY